MSNLHRELANGPSPAQDDDPLVFLGRFGAVFGQFEFHARQKTKARGLDTTFESVKEVKKKAVHLQNQSLTKSPAPIVAVSSTDKLAPFFRKTPSSTRNVS